MSFLKNKLNKLADDIIKAINISSFLYILSVLILLCREMFSEPTLFIWRNDLFNKYMSKLPTALASDSFFNFILFVVFIWVILLVYPALVSELGQKDNWFAQTFYDMYFNSSVIYNSGKVRTPYGWDNYEFLIKKLLQLFVKTVWLITNLLLFCLVLNGTLAINSWASLLLLIIGAVVTLNRLVMYFDTSEGYLYRAPLKDWKENFDYMLSYSGTYKSQHGVLYLFGSRDSSHYFILFCQCPVGEEPRDDFSQTSKHRFNSYTEAQNYIDVLKRDFMTLDEHSMKSEEILQKLITRMKDYQIIFW